MEEVDYSIESDEEFFEDFSGRTLSDKELDKILIKARKNSDAALRIYCQRITICSIFVKEHNRVC